MVGVPALQTYDGPINGGARLVQIQAGSTKSIQRLFVLFLSKCLNQDFWSNLHAAFNLNLEGKPGY